MDNLPQEQTINDQIAAQLQAKIWTVETAINILATIQFNKQGKFNFADVGLISKIQTQCAKFVHDGIEYGNLHPINRDQSQDTLSKIASGVASGFGLGSIFSGGGSVLSVGTGVATGLGAGVVAPVLITGGLAAAAFRFLPTARKKEKFLQSLLIPAEVVNYAKLRGRWLNDEELPTTINVRSETSRILNEESPQPAYTKDNATQVNDKTCHGEIGAATTSPLKERNNRGAKALWDPRDKIIIKATEFMRTLVNECQCLCRHNKLAGIAYEYGNDGKSFKSLDKKSFNLLKQFKAAALKIVPEERQYGNDGDKNKITKYNPEACRCEIREHKEFKPNRE